MTAQEPPRMSRQTAASMRVETLLVASERMRACLAPASPAERKAVQRKIHTGQVVSPSPGLFARASYWNGLDPSDQTLHLVRGLSGRHATWAFRLYSAAAIWHLDVPFALLDKIYVISKRQPRRQQASRATTSLVPISSRMPSPLDRIEMQGGIPVTGFTQTVFECLRDAPFSLGLAIADSALRRTGQSPEQLCAQIAREQKRRHGLRRATEVLSYADSRSENGGESRVRAFLIEQGYLLPELQVELPNPLDPRNVYRVDFLWRLPDGRIVVGEFDGMGKYTDEDMLAGSTTAKALVAERQRESRITLLGFPVLRFTYQDLAHPYRLHNLLRAAGIPRSQEATRRFHASWNAAQGNHPKRRP